MNVRIRFSASQITTADDCRRLHWYRSIEKVKVATTAANLIFGRCIDVSTREFLRALTLGDPLPDPMDRFLNLWRAERKSTAITYSATQAPEDFERMGTDLMRALPSAWDKTGFRVALKANGEPMLDVPLLVLIGQRGDIEVELLGVLDVVVHTRDMELAVVDIKSAAASHTPFYTLRSDQLTAYQLLMNAHVGRLGLPSLKKLGFWDFLKRKASARVDDPLLVPLRPSKEIVEFHNKLFWLAEDIQRGRFPKTSRMQFNTPCEMCDYKKHCVHGDPDGLIFTKQKSAASV